MKKYKHLRKRTLTETGIAAALVLVTAGAMFAVSGMRDGAEKERKSMQSKVQSVKREADKSKERLESAGASMTLYDALKKERDAMSLTLDRQEMTALLGQLKEKYRLSSLNLQISSEIPYEDEELKTMKLDVVSSDVRLDFGGISDQHLFSFVNELRRKLPGFVRVKEVSLNRNKIFDIEAMRQISQGAKLEMVSGTLAFQWFGYPEVKKKANGQP